MLSDEKLKEILEGAEGEITKYLIDEAKKSVADKINYELQDELSKIVKDFIENELAPDIRTALMNNKPVIMKSVVKMSNKMADALSEKLLADLVENLGSSYTRGQIWKALFD